VVVVAPIWLQVSAAAAAAAAAVLDHQTQALTAQAALSTQAEGAAVVTKKPNQHKHKAAQEAQGDQVL
jgi:hypothetical protein